MGHFSFSMRPTDFKKFKQGYLFWESMMHHPLLHIKKDVKVVSRFGHIV